MKTYILLAISVLASLSQAQSDDQKLSPEQSFAKLFNQYRIAQPANMPWAGSFFPYSQNGTAVGIKGNFRSKGSPELSAIYKYDSLFNGSGHPATQFENENHSCDHFSGEQKSGCEAWWGHCNGWTAAALKEKEPTHSFTYKGEELEVGHMKGILSELWLSTNSYFVGSTNKTKRTGQWIYNPEDPDYQQFWDVTPKQVFFIFTNQIGVQKVGVAIDRFTGEQVWNQPVAGYHILPIRPADLGKQEILVDGKIKKLYYANVRMKIYWANDDVYENHVSLKFDIFQSSETELEPSIVAGYTMRLLRFKMFFNEPLQVSQNGLEILNDPKVVHPGIWHDQESQDSPDPDQEHPDFIWQPINPYIVNSGYENPHLGWDNVKKLTLAMKAGSETHHPPPPVEPPQPPAPTEDPEPSPIATVFTITVQAQNVSVPSNDREAVKELIMKVFKRAGLSLAVDAAHIKFVGGNRVQFRALSQGGLSQAEIFEAFANVGATVISIQ